MECDIFSSPQGAVYLTRYEMAKQTWFHGPWVFSTPPKKQLPRAITVCHCNQSDSCTRAVNMANGLLSHVARQMSIRILSNVRVCFSTENLSIYPAGLWFSHLFSSKMLEHNPSYHRSNWPTKRSIHKSHEKKKKKKKRHIFPSLRFFFVFLFFFLISSLFFFVIWKKKGLYT